MYTGLAFAMGPPPGADPSGFDIFMSFAPLIGLFAIFYFLLIRPQQKKRNETESMIQSLKEGDNILTGGGIYGTIVKVKDDVLTLQIADNVKIKMNRNYVSSLK
ncbi:MAG: preprotein translocase subunit YajC [bacterium]|nr:MAG: preprotein translocase subunit YajC [bacterium]